MFQSLFSIKLPSNLGLIFVTLVVASIAAMPFTRQAVVLCCSIASLVLLIDTVSAFWHTTNKPLHSARYTQLQMTRDTQDMAAAFQPFLQKQPPRPNSCTYWVTDSVMAGEFPTTYGTEQESRAKIRRYLESGITTFVDLTEKGERPDYTQWLQQEADKLGIAGKVQHIQLPIGDFGTPTRQRMKETLDVIDTAIAENGKVYVHCRGGIGRTGTTVGCYLVRHGLGGSDALDHVNRLFQYSDRSKESYYSPETPKQMDFVRQWTESDSSDE
jgi:protein-tyrosine phosphatase